MKNAAPHCRLGLPDPSSIFVFAFLLSQCPVPEIGGTLPEVSWLFFQGTNEDPYLTDTGRESNAEKQPTGSGPEGCDENGRTAALLVG
jgi:hypothetical protein